MILREYIFNVHVYSTLMYYFKVPFLLTFYTFKEEVDLLFSFCLSTWFFVLLLKAEWFGRFFFFF